MRKKIISLLLVLLMMLHAGMSVSAESTDQNATIQKLQEKIAELEERISILEELLLDKEDVTTLTGEKNDLSGKELYSGEWGTLTYQKIDSSGITFKIENTTDVAYNIYSQYLTIDGTQYDDGWDEVNEQEIGGVYANIDAGTSREIKFQISLENVDFSELQGQFLITEFATGNHMGLISF